mgnify:CR=1 FL=1
MSLTSIQLCTIDPVERAAGKFQVTVHSDDGRQLAIFDCSSEMDALHLRTAIREHADQLRRVADYRERKTSAATAGQVPVGYVCERAALVRLRDDVDNLPLHAHKRALVRDWISVALAKIDADAEAATGSAA